MVAQRGNNIGLNKFRLRFTLNSTTFCLVLALAISSFYNMNLWSGMFARFEQLSIPSLAFALMFFGLMVLLTFLLASLFNHRWLLKPAAITLTFCAAAIAYFNHIGVVFDSTMIKNITQTNLHESLELLNPSLIGYLLLMGAAPAMFIAGLNIHYTSPWHRLKTSSYYSVGMAMGIGALLMSNFQFTTFFGRENRDLRLYVNPVYPILAARSYLRSELKTPQAFVQIGADSKQIKTNQKRTVGILVVGETARADHFAINGYNKNTTPHLNERLAKGQLFNFSDVTACGTSTAYSVPCMFSLLGAKDYSPDKANHQSNVLDILETAGVKTFWRDNNSDCKGVCARIENENFRENIDEKSRFFHQGEYLDEILLSNLESIIAATDKDILIVLHQLGSHGPAYSRRYPKEFAKFGPSCTSSAPQNCSPEEVSNSYDNTILYTDYILEKTIALLEQHSESYQSFMMYVSDHGESLGENGVYLHGLPRSIAPKSQTHVPFVLWLSDDMYNAFATPVVHNDNCTEQQFSHDNISHTLLSAFNVETSVKVGEASVVSHCTSTERLAKQP